MKWNECNSIKLIQFLIVNQISTKLKRNFRITHFRTNEIWPFQNWTRMEYNKCHMHFLADMAFTIRFYLSHVESSFWLSHVLVFVYLRNSLDKRQTMATTMTMTTTTTTPPTTSVCRLALTASHEHMLHNSIYGTHFVASLLAIGFYWILVFLCELILCSLLFTLGRQMQFICWCRNGLLLSNSIPSNKMWKRLKKSKPMAMIDIVDWKLTGILWIVTVFLLKANAKYHGISASISDGHFL